MDEAKRVIIEKRIAKTMENLERNNMQAFYAKDKEEALKLVESLMPAGQTVSCGGSVTLQECGVKDLLKSGKYNFLDRSVPGLTAEQIKEIYRKTFFADTFLTSSNAITEDGELYNVDGNSNRVAALTFGPDSVIVVAGYNKIVSNIDAAVERVKKIAAPINAVQLKRETPCAKVGECMNCHSKDRICCTYVMTSQQRIKHRIKVVLIGEELGF